MREVSIYVPAYNCAEYLPRCLEGILAQTHKPDEILVIDDGSRDSTPEIAHSYEGIKVISHGENRGLGAARNSAFEAARSELVASLDADCVPEPDWLETLLTQFQDERTAGTGGRLVEGVRDTMADRWRCAHMRQEWGEDPVEDPPFLFGCNNVFRKSAVLAAGGYDPEMRSNGEDADLSRRLKAQGWRLAYEPGARVTHLRHDTVASVMDAYWRWTFHGFENRRDRLTLYRIVRRAILGNVWYMFRGLAQRDVGERRWELILMDLGLLLYFPQRELREWLRLWQGRPRSSRATMASRLP